MIVNLLARLFCPLCSWDTAGSHLHITFEPFLQELNFPPGWHDSDLHQPPSTVVLSVTQNVARFVSQSRDATSDLLLWFVPSPRRPHKSGSSSRLSLTPLLSIVIILTVPYQALQVDVDPAARAGFRITLMMSENLHLEAISRSLC